jgi:hypothetical protein
MSSADAEKFEGLGYEEFDLARDFSKLVDTNVR